MAQTQQKTKKRKRYVKKFLVMTGLTLGLSLNIAWADNNATTSSSANTTNSTATTAPSSPQPTTTPNSSSTTTSTSTNNSFNPSQVSDIEKVVHDYLIRNPYVLVQASQALQAQEVIKAQQTAVKAVAQNQAKLFSDPNSPVIGNPQGNVILVEFLDYQCGHCKNMSAIVAGLIKQNPNLKVIIKQLPIFGGNSDFAARAALAAMKQNHFPQMHDALFNQENPLSKQSVLDIAKNLGLDIEKLQKDMNDPAISKQIRDNFQLAQDLRLMGTPAFVLTNAGMSQFKYIPGATTADDLQQQINVLKPQQEQQQAQAATGQQNNNIGNTNTSNNVATNTAHSS
jgi:protein-disulfide isomerase